jgi:hypothetical protein
MIGGSPVADNDGLPAGGTVDDLDLRRRRRFGKLPKRVRPEEFVEMVESDPARETHEPTEPRREWGV